VEKMTIEKQAEVAEMQKKLLDDMEKTLQRREDLLWAEEELFSHGIAQNVRGGLQAALGRIQLTLERFSLLEPDKRHEWRNWLKFLKVGPKEVYSGFREVKADLQLVANSLEEYMVLTQRKTPELKSVNIRDLIKNVISEHYEDRVKSGIIEMILDDVPEVMGDPHIISFCIRALLENALESLSLSGGTVKIRTGYDGGPEKVWIEISDSGCGIPSGTEDRIFQPFFTTKTGHKGLSLTRVRRYLKWHHGSLRLVETDKSGSIFLMEFPKKEEVKN